MNNLLPGISQRLAELARGSVQVAGPVSPIGEQLPEFQPGERYTAQIIQNLQDGRARAQVAGQMVTLQLPQGAREGSTVTLTHVSRNAQTLIATLVPDSAAGETADVSLSEPARAISALLDRPAPPPTRLSAGQALIDPAMLRASANVTDAAATPLIAGRLASAIGQSGLFYESHQAQWVSGERTIESTEREPQRAFDPHTRATPAAGQRADTATLARAGAEFAQISDAAAPEKAEAARADSATPAELRPLVHNQLLGLSQHSLAWEGLAWPGQMMKIEIDDPRADGRADEVAAEADADVPWTSRLRLVLPGLGEIETSLTLWRDHGIALSFSSDPEARLRMGGALLELQQRMSDAGLRLGQVTFGDAAPITEGEPTEAAEDDTSGPAGAQVMA
ncbi:flagellar hook-length control FliK family protein [Methyloversatilis sp. RAC08]|uniref:flagellar hook-length control protein FliK n=1 Tax=Methyloversatilis sp. RAC08 TaxID=1842540 RepID=UPI00083E41B2|nr:flagellar hook-length control protein FliK [Methyloversatilis sp. RAC08]AOF81383.1 flagellar hook-length control FliK family protein [Methyloversatilis sp. RAC08]